jgi:hypothetical protein
MKDAVKRGATEAEQCDEHTTCMAKYPRFPATIRSSFKKEVMGLPLGTKGTTGLWLWPTKADIGKTTWVNMKYPGAYDKLDARWMDGYDEYVQKLKEGEDQVVFWDDPVQATIGQSAGMPLLVAAPT